MGNGYLPTALEKKPDHKFPPRANETDGCPPHYFVFDVLNVGRCKKPGCTAVTDCGKLLLKRQYGQNYALKSASKGGRKSHPRTGGE